MTRRKKWFVGTGAGLLLLVVTVSTLDWNLARPYIARQVTRSTGRSFEIKGNLELHCSLWGPRIIANDIVMGNAEWSKDPTMAQIKRVDLTVSMLKLMIGRLSFPELSLSDFHMALEINKDGTPNWVFGKAGKKRRFPHIGSLAIDNGTLTYRDPTSSTNLSFVLNTSAVKGEQDIVELAGKGKIRGMDTKLHLRGGALLALRRADRPYPVKAVLTVGMTRASINGTLLDPLHLKKEKVNFILEGSDLAELYSITGVPFPPTPTYKLTGHLSHANDIWTFKDFEGKVGTSDLSGDLSVDGSTIPQLITADLGSRRLELKDLSGFIGAELVSGPRNKVLPTRPYNLEKIRAADADVRFKGEEIITEDLPIEKMDAHLVIKDGTLKLAPLDFKTAGGHLVTAITMDVRGSHIVTHADITAKRLHLDQLLPTSKLPASQGIIGGRAKLDATGDSISQMMGTANGEAALIMDGGNISEMVLRLSNLDFANSFLLLLGGDKNVPIRCAVANFKAVDGNFKVQDLVLDTPKVNITGDGNVNFADESLHLKLASRSKGFSLVSLRGPILVTGTLMKPKVKPDTAKVATRGGAAVGLAVATVGVAGLIPLLDFGDSKDSNCAALMDQARSDAGIKQSDIAPK